jgi:hypothetical protein
MLEQVAKSVAFNDKEEEDYNSLDSITNNLTQLEDDEEAFLANAEMII